jgi:type III restriction enzyme
VAETKSTLDSDMIRNIEHLKIKCGEKHFAEFNGVTYRKVTEVKELYA